MNLYMCFFYCMIAACFLLSNMPLYAQSFQVSGKIIDEYGEPLPGVSVMVKGSNIGTISGVNGDYSITVPFENVVLLFTFGGYNTMEVVANRQNISVTMTPQLYVPPTGDFDKENKRVRRNRQGNILLIAGGGLLVSGAVIFATQPFDLRHNFTGLDGNAYYRYRDDALGIAIAASGAVMAGVGITLKLASKASDRKSVTMRNDGMDVKTDMEFNLGFTGNGIRLSLNF